MEEKTLIVIAEDGTEKEMDILFTFADETFKKEYVLYVDPLDESGDVFVSSYTDEGELNSIEDPKEWELIEEVFSAFIVKHEGEEEAIDNEHTH